ncbi:MAG: serine/threonine protein kinase [Nannocystaceae bacterium]|nr:serine/threonine protein kinase [Nannocystaceae bacterium]
MSQGPNLVSTELVGQRVMERYTIQERIARGGMSVVYRGEDERLRRPVCVKVFCGLDPSRPGYRTVHEHFVQEAFALSALRHPNTIRIFDFGYLEDELATPYFVVEYADGGTLKEFVRKHGPLTPHEAFEILEPIAGALREAHAAGIIHRDIKPSNILFVRAGPALVVKLADFSIAKAVEDAIPNRAEDTLNSSDKVGLYSLGWAAPEQLRSDPVGPSADVFALGLTLSYMLTCKMVYPGDDILQLFELRRLGDPYIRKALAEQGIDDELLRVISYACRANPPERLQSVEQFVEAVRESIHESWRNVTSKQERLASPPAPPQPIARATAPAIPQAPPPPPPTPSHLVEGLSGSILTTAAASSSSSSMELLGVRPLVVDSLTTHEIVVGGRRIRPVEVASERTMGAEAGVVGSQARFRVTARELGGLHLKGLNCFVIRDHGRPSSGVEMDRDGELTFIAPNRDVLDRAVVLLGAVDGTYRSFALPGAALAVPLRRAAWSAMLDLGPGRETILLYRSNAGP